MALSFMSKAFSQNFLGIQSSNWSGVNGVYFNPASLADGRYRQHVNASCFGFATSTNAAKFELPFSFLNLVTNNVPDQYKNPAGGIDWDAAWFKVDKSSVAKYINVNLEFRGPGFMTRLGKKNAVAISTRTRLNFSVNNVNQQLIDFAIGAIDTGLNSVRSINNNSFTMNSHAYQEISGSFARVVKNEGALYLKLGVTAKYLMGIASGNIQNREIDARLAATDDTLIFNRTDIEVNHSNIGYLDNFSQAGILSFLLPRFNQINGSGLGFDAGAIFEYRPELTDGLTSKNKYLFKGGLSLMDIGTINMKQDITRYSASNSSPVKLYADSAFSAAFAQGTDSGLAHIKRFAEQNLNYKQGASKYVVNLPMTLGVQLDWNIFKWFYLGANWNQSLVSIKSVSIRRPSSFSLIPRIETKLFELAIPVQVYDDYKQFGLGIFTRIGPVFLGSDNLLQSITGNSINGFDFYFGVSTGIPAKKARKKKD